MTDDTPMPPPTAACDWYDMVRVFHKAFGHPAPDEITLMERDRQRYRAQWLAEEVVEYAFASNMIEQVDAIIDLIVFALGSLVEMGIDPRGLFDAVHEANMGKLYPDGKPRYRDDGKLLKPANWESPERVMEKIIQARIYQESEQQYREMDEVGEFNQPDENGEIPF